MLLGNNPGHRYGVELEAAHEVFADSWFSQIVDAVIKLAAARVIRAIFAIGRYVMV